jgi:hypothetical protein
MNNINNDDLGLEHAMSKDKRRKKRKRKNIPKFRSAAAHSLEEKQFQPQTVPDLKRVNNKKRLNKHDILMELENEL